MTAVVHRGDERRCDHRADAWQLREPPTGFVCSAKTQELLIQLIEPEIESAELFKKVDEELAYEIRKLRGRDRVLRLRQNAMRLGVR